jgi:hypothetical protein
MRAMQKLSGNIIIIILLIFNIGIHAEKKYPPSIKESKNGPVKYIGNRQTNKYVYDGKLPHAAGVHTFQVFRANRSNPTEGGLIGWTYSHAPMLAFWNGKFYLQYLSNLKEEHGAPGRTLIAVSENGTDWTNPKVVFPVYPLPEIDAGFGYVPKGMASVMHQRMGFYVAPKGKFLTIGFYSYCATPRHSPNRGQGLGRVVREIYKDGSFGPIYFIRYNRHAGWNETNTDYPFYKESDDQAFLQACEDLLSNKLATLQWWEMDPVEYSVGDWRDIELKLDCETQSYDVYLDKALVKEKTPFAVKTKSLQRIVFRTGPWRGDVRPFIVDGEPGNPGLYQEDLPGADLKTGTSIFEIDNIQTTITEAITSGE